MTTIAASGYNLAFSHMGYFVSDIGRMADFYSRVLGFFITDRGMLNGREVVFFSRDPREHHQIVMASGKDAGAQQNINQISFRVGSLAELKTFHDRLAAAGTSGMDPVIHGNSWSIYFHDPEGNRLEVFADTDWYINQPFKEPLDLTRPEAEIRAYTRDYCATREGFRSIEQWRAEMRALMQGDPAA